jgi:hypothetical protein
VISRRGVLGLAVVTLAGLVGCSSSTSGNKGSGSGGNGTKADPDAAVLAEAIADIRALIARYDNAPGSVPKKIIALRADHLAHLAALGATATASPSPSATFGTGGEPSAKPTAGALAQLAAAEKAAAQRRVDQCKRARSAELARLLASIGGCEAAHASLLDALGGKS